MQSRQGRTSEDIRGEKEGIGMKAYLHGPLDAAKNLKLRFRVGDLDLPERKKRYTSKRVEEEVVGHLLNRHCFHLRKEPMIQMDYPRGVRVKPIIVEAVFSEISELPDSVFRLLREHKGA